MFILTLVLSFIVKLRFPPQTSIREALNSAIESETLSFKLYVLPEVYYPYSQYDQ